MATGKQTRPVNKYIDWKKGGFTDISQNQKLMEIFGFKFGEIKAYVRINNETGDLEILHWEEKMGEYKEKVDQRITTCTAKYLREELGLTIDLRKTFAEQVRELVVKIAEIGKRVGDGNWYN